MTNPAHDRKHPGKIIIGRIRRWLDFLGYRFSPAGLTIAPPALERFVERATRLYEQGTDQARIGWYRWARAGVTHSS